MPGQAVFRRLPPVNFQPTPGKPKQGLLVFVRRIAGRSEAADSLAHVIGPLRLAYIHQVFVTPRLLRRVGGKESFTLYRLRDN